MTGKRSGYRILGKACAVALAGGHCLGDVGDVAHVFIVRTLRLELLLEIVDLEDLRHVERVVAFVGIDIVGKLEDIVGSNIGRSSGFDQIVAEQIA